MMVQKKFISLLILSVFVLSIFSISLVAAADNDCNFWCRLVALFTGKIQVTGNVLSIAELPPPAVQWNVTAGGSGYDFGFSVQQTTDGGYIVTGYTGSFGAGGDDVWLLKYDSNGNLQWNKTFGGSADEYGNSVQQTTDGGYIIGGTKWVSAFEDSWLIKTDSNGNLQWNKTFGAGSNSDEGIESVRQTADGGYIAAGYIYKTSGDYDFLLLKYDSNGNLQWNKTFGGSGYDRQYYGNSVQQTTDGGYILTGYTTSFGTGGGGDVWLIKTYSNGSLQWNKTFGGTGDDYGYSVQQTSDGGYIIGGHREYYGGGWLIKTDSNGAMQWNKTGYYNLDKVSSLHSVQQTSDGGYIIGGTKSIGWDSLWVGKTDSNGDLLWNKTFGAGTGTQYIGFSGMQTSDGGYITTGFAGATGWADVLLVKFANCGNYVCESGENAVNCPADCAPQCGNGVKEGTEACDDGNSNNNDACKNNCQNNVCGDTLIYIGVEACDSDTVGCINPQGYSGTKTCLPDCSGYNTCITTESCGDGIINNGEQCDNGTLLNGIPCTPLYGQSCNYCSSSCTTATVPIQQWCGNSVKEGPEACDSDTVGCINPQGYSGTKTCLLDCSGYGSCETTEYCGDGIRNNGEQCDDANENNNDACKSDCTFNVCGDGFINVGVEACDDGNNVNGDGCNAQCITEYCGDNIVQAGLGEACDDGNSNNNDACKNNCQNNVCGDGVVYTGSEQCDDGNSNNNDACKSDCTFNVCGDGFINVGVEACDDGNNVNGDGCNAQCITEYCGDGIIQNWQGHTEQCDGSIGGETCSSQTGGERPLGTLTCNSSCNFDTSQCYPLVATCTETDSGNDPTRSGTTTITLGSDILEQHADSCNTGTLTEYYCSDSSILSQNIDCKTYNDKPCMEAACIPEFTTIGMGIALIGSGIGYFFIRKKKK